MTKITKIVGGPGTGKTTSLLNEIEKKLDYGISSDDICYLTFTKSATVEGRERMIQKAGISKADLKKSVRTTHSLAYKGMNSNFDVVQPYHKEEFADKWGLDYNRSLKGKGISDKIDVPTGNALFTLADYLTETQMKIKEYYKAPINVPLPNQKVKNLLHTWRLHKYSNNLYTHADYMSDVVDTYFDPEKDYFSCNPYNFKYYFIDEVMDFTPLQYKFLELLMESADEIYLAGDSDQSVYGFRGANPKTFSEMEVDEVKRVRKSHRVPNNILAKAKRLLGEYSLHTLADLKGKSSDGTLEFKKMNDINELVNFTEKLINKSEKDCMILTRTNRQVNKLRRAFDKTDVDNETLSTILFERESYFDNRKVTFRDPVLRIGTIHSSKGLESEIVILLTDYTSNLTDYYFGKEGESEERRLYYVGMTRAEEALFIVDRMDIDYHFPALEGGMIG